jgi:hypothetical protein
MATATLNIKIWTARRASLPADTSELAEWLAPHVEHVAKACEEGYLAGEIVDERFSGWWEIKRK